MGVEQRPYVGTWRLNNRKIVKTTPDCLVYVNGDLSVPGCPSCGGRIDIQEYITQVSVDPSTEGPSTASISLHVPRTMGDGLFRDGNFILRPGLEVHVYLRGYFPVKGLTSEVTPEQAGGIDVRNAVMYPYYMVFHGVMTDVNHAYSGGEHTATISCADMLHFWQYQRMSTNGSLFGARPMNSKVKMSLVGHNMTGLSPYAIIYQLFRDVQGSAGGVEFALGNQTNAAANSTVIGESLFSLSILYWQKRFAQTTTSLRMYGADGTLYNAFQAAYLASLKSDDPAKLANKYGANNAQSMELDPLIRASRVAGFDPFSVGLGSSGSNEDGKLGINVAQLQAFTSDISQWGNVNFWESQYATKLEIATNVKEACGYEFYQDVDGDIVFKPPFYNLDTSTSRVYRIEDVDLISFDVASKEPEATVVKVTGGHFRNMTGTGLENNEWGTRAEFIDYRLVAQFGWRPQSFETTYHTDSKAMFFACVARFDIFNIGMNSATATIPIRPELRPGYPVYIVALDCYYYLHSFSHSFSFGGQCTTTLNLVGRRAKFFAPGNPPLDGAQAQVGDIRLNNMHLPALPLQVTEVDGVGIVPRLQGFPNVVMSLDPELINPLSFAQGIDVQDLQTEDAIRNLIRQAQFGRLSVLQRSEEGEATDEASQAYDGPWQIQTGSSSAPIILSSVADLLAQAQKVRSLYDNKNARESDVARVEAEVAPLLALVEAAKDTHARMFASEDASATYLELLGDVKAAYNPGSNLPGYYRYYSSAHPDVEMQGPATWSVSAEGILSTGAQTPPDESRDQVAVQFQATAEGGTTFVSDGVVRGGIPILKPGTKDQTVSTPTHQITTFQIARFMVDKSGSRSIEAGVSPAGFPVSALSAAYQKFFLERMGGVPVGPTSIVGEVFLPTYDLIATLIEEKVGEYPAFPNATSTFSEIGGFDPPSKLRTQAQAMADACASTVGSILSEKMKVVQPVTGRVSSSFGAREAPTEGASTEHAGEDIAAPVGTPIYAALAGTVSFAGKRGGYGNLIIIAHPDGTFTRYAHCDTILVSKGQVVEAGEQIGTVGKSGNVTGPHLHFEVRTSTGAAVDPDSYLDSLGGAVDTHDIEAIWASVWPAGSQVQAGVGRNRRNKVQAQVKYYDVPVLPVSDARGYEVVGTFRYGRGLSLETLDQMSGFSPSTTDDYESVEQFISTITSDGSASALSVAIGNLSPSLQASLASGTLSDDVLDILTLEDPGGSQTTLRGMNTPSNKREFVQKATLTNTAYSLADMNLTAGRRAICACRGAEADTLLQAFNGEFVGVGETETVQDWLSEQMVGASVDWAAAQGAYRGTVLDIRSAGVLDALEDGD